MKIAVIGSRDFDDYGVLEAFLDGLRPAVGIEVIVSGGAKGADSLAERYARDRDIPMEVHRPDWKTFGRSAAFIRNRSIVDCSDMVVAFWDGKSLGTQNAVDYAKRKGKKVHVVPCLAK